MQKIVQQLLVLLYLYYVQEVRWLYEAFINVVGYEAQSESAEGGASA